MGNIHKYIFKRKGDTFLPFVATWDTANTSTGSSASNQIKLPAPLVDVNCIIDWGDGNSDVITDYLSNNLTHTYSTSGVYTIKIKGKYNGFRFNNIGDKLKITSILNFGDLGIGTFAFSGCANLILDNVTDILKTTNLISLQGLFSGCVKITTIPYIYDWDVSLIQSFNQTFTGCTNFNQNLSSWDMSSATDTSGMFIQCFKFNQSLNNWNVSNVTNFLLMFNSCYVFNQPLNDWDVSKGLNFDSMFKDCYVFNQNLSSWDMSSAIIIKGMFENARKFNQPIENWNVSNVTNMTFLLAGAGDFNQPMNNFNVSNQTNLSGFFQGCSKFNQPLNFWDVSNVTNMSYMFGGNTYGGSVLFNQNIGNWNMSKVTSISYMFAYCTNFNNGNSDTIKNWDVSKNTSFQAMFYIARRFNQPIGSWNMSLATNLNYMLGQCDDFNQDIGNWNVSNVTAFAYFLQSKTYLNFSASNLDAIYIGWSSRSVKPNITIDFYTIKRTITSDSAKVILQGAPNNWIITDGGII